MQQIIEELYERYQVNIYRNPIHLLTIILRMFDDLRMQQIDKDEITGRLFLLKNDLSPMEFRIAKSIALLIQKLPMDTTVNDECRASPSITINQDRPDACITALNGAVWGTGHGFGEVKCFSQAENKFAVAKDLIRLGHLSKNAIDIHNMNGVLVFQVVGRHVFFYLTKLMHDGLYIMLEIDKIELPASVYSLPTYIAQAHRLLNVISIYQQCIPCNNDTKDMLHSRKRKTYDIENTVVLKTRNRKRPSITTYRHQ
ncbi:hypothetical protein RO3G_11197 [Rhizopus delemar RA 99-880]|uniref:Uncharacterized protein n=3 Tax=Rhizopus TaxID=4842 RepID=I1CDF6_RHIO9|nr:hypothetical protein RO3G_11197 [Rhizopus delemar RA 99-880]|eukprot:EIE86486.1 hypothetical protein RO3G_11197 [Rhizopus delemar RA 99-880]